MYQRAGSCWCCSGSMHDDASCIWRAIPEHGLSIQGSRHATQFSGMARTSFLHGLYLSFTVSRSVVRLKVDNVNSARTYSGMWSFPRSSDVTTGRLTVETNLDIPRSPRSRVQKSANLRRRHADITDKKDVPPTSSALQSYANRRTRIVTRRPIRIVRRANKSSTRIPEHIRN